MKADNTELEKAKEWFNSLSWENDVKPMVNRFKYNLFSGRDDNDILKLYQDYQSETSQAETSDLCCGMYSHVEVTENPKTTVTYVTAETPESVAQAALIFIEFEKFAELSEFMFEMARSGKSPWKWSRFCEVINDLCKKQSEQSPSTCKEDQWFGSLSPEQKEGVIKAYNILNPNGNLTVKESQGDIAELVEALSDCVNYMPYIDKERYKSLIEKHKSEPKQ